MLKNEKGAAAVEFAIVLPIFLILVFGVIEFGFALYDKALITNASREGARFAILFEDPVNSDTDIETRVKSKLNYLDDNPSASDLINLGAPGSTVTVSVLPATRTTGTDVTVTVNYTYSFLVLPSFMSIGDLNLSGQTTMRME